MWDFIVNQILFNVLAIGLGLGAVWIGGWWTQRRP
jgi:hypothetical protein